MFYSVYDSLVGGINTILGWMFNFWSSAAGVALGIAALIIHNIPNALEALMDHIKDWCQIFMHDMLGGALDAAIVDVTDHGQIVWDQFGTVQAFLPVKECAAIIAGAYGIKLSIRVARWGMSFIPWINGG